MRSTARNENKWDTTTTRGLPDPHNSNNNKRTAGTSPRFRRNESRLDETGKYVTSVGEWETQQGAAQRTKRMNHNSRFWSDAGRSHGRWNDSAVSQPDKL